MARTTPERPNRVHHVVSLGAKIATATAALATVLGYVHSVGLDGSATRRTMGTFGAAWIGVAPRAETAWSIGDTLHLAATVTDKHGTALVGATMTWTSTDPQVAPVVDGQVVSRAPGVTTVVAAVGDLMARATVVVRPRVAAVHLASDTSVTLAEGAVHPVSLRAADARGHLLIDRPGVWRSADTAVVAVDSGGRITGTGAGHTVVSATVDGVTAQVPVTVVPVPGALGVIAGSQQDGPAGTLLPTPVVVRVTSQRGRPLPNTAVRFRRVDAGGAVDIAVVSTDAAGNARTTWRLGDFPGRQHLVASIEGSDSTAVAEAEAEPVANNTRATPLDDGQTAPIATALAQHVGIHLADSSGRALADVPVTWTTPDGGTVTATRTRSDSSGDAEASWVLGPMAGSQRVRAVIGNGRLVKPAVVHAKALSGPATTLAAVSGNGQRGAVGGALPKPVVLRVTDAAGNAVPNVKIVLTPHAGALTDTFPSTDSSGVVRARWTLPAGPPGAVFHLTARVDGVLRPVDVTATTAIVTPPRTTARAHRHSS